MYVCAEHYTSVSVIVTIIVMLNLSWKKYYSNTNLSK
jgi:hypothetical protein